MKHRKNVYLLMSFIVMACFTVINSCDKEENKDDDKYSVGGTVEGLSGSGLVLQNNGGDDLSITDNGAFTFSTKMEDSSDYDVTIKSYPEGQTCGVENGTGTVAGADVTNVQVSCQELPLGGNCPDGSITYNHDLANDYQGFHQEIQVSGTIPFTCDDEGNFSGSGTLTAHVSGEITQPCTAISYEGDATINVTLTGQFLITELHFDSQETWYVGSPMVSGTYTDTCGDDFGPYNFPLPQNMVTQPLGFPNIDGYILVGDYEGAAGSGTYTWTLHIY